MLKRLLTALMALGLLSGAEVPKNLSVEVKHDNAEFRGTLAIAMIGSMSKAKLEWYGTLRNASLKKIFRVTLCVKAFDEANQQIKPGGSECILTLWGSNWAPGAALNFKGKQNIKVSDDKSPVRVAAYTVGVTELFDHSPNLRNLSARCPLVWSAALRVFAEKKFRPTVMDKDSFTATYAYDGGRIDGLGGATQMLKAYTTANTAFMGPTWESFRIDAASLYLREEQGAGCVAEVRMTFAGFGKPFLGALGWYAVESNFNLEKTLLDALEAQSNLATSADLDKAISELPTEAPKPVENLARPQLTITSEPTGAEIEINDEFIGNAPTTVTTKEGKVVVKIKLKGFQPWERTLSLNPGDKRTLKVELLRP